MFDGGLPGERLLPPDAELEAVDDMVENHWRTHMGRIDGSRRWLLGAFLLLGLCFAIGGYAAEGQGAFNVTYKSEVEPLPLNQIHSWLLHVETADGKPVEKASIKVDGGMPAHHHGLPTQPAVTEVGNGDYLVQGIKFSMTGHWEMWFEIQADGTTEKKKFGVDF